MSPPTSCDARGHRIRLARQPMDLLLLLLERRQELVSREDIAKRLWGAGRLHRSRCWHPHGHSQDPTGVGRLARVAAIRRDRAGQGLSLRRAGRGRRPAHPEGATSAMWPHSERLPGTRRHNLPAELTSFVGRRKELLELPGVLASSRLLSLTGAGGVGKTRLAVRLASEPRERIPRRRVAGRSGAALGARSGGADDRDRPRYPRRPAAIGPRRPARRRCAIASSCSCWITAST